MDPDEIFIKIKRNKNTDQTSFIYITHWLAIGCSKKVKDVQ